ncbi:hypothetical protein NE237_011497 [Protea cynaroides]|uniref:C3H1-type domain-containing protein n=1 Tax=Protea cynaroides TaxID=273540 RepID=A0A9Q0H009_9MAGN|nr:hypothetical protein NE237_011497 [Protea cynaroides]
MLKGINRGFLKFIHSTDYTESMYESDEFRMYVFKIKKCPKTRSHDWTCCPFAHYGEKARRRDPRKFKYAAVACPEFRTGECRKGESCEFAHGIFEFWLHPDKYRTRECNAGKYCRRKVCFFSHTPEQLRPEMKKKSCYVCRVRMEGGKKDESCGSVGDGRTELSSSPVNMVMRNGNLKEDQWDIEETLRRFKIEDDQDGEEMSFSDSDVLDLPDIDWIKELVK